MKKEINFIEERDRDLLLAYARLSRRHKELPSYKVAELAANSPARRFYVNPVEVERTLRERRLGLDTGSHRRTMPLKVEMYDELEDRVRKNRRRNGNDEHMAVYKAVFSTAPKFYLSIRYASVCIARSLRKNRPARREQEELK